MLFHDGYLSELVGRRVVLAGDAERHSAGKVVDFFVARKWPAEGLKKHPWSTRTMWQSWFANDNVFLSPDHIPCKS